jgi:hypothetical protein
MLAAIRQQVTVEPGGVVEIRAPNLQPGMSVEVIVLVGGRSPEPRRRSLESFIGAGKGHFGRVEDVDAPFPGTP